MRFDERSLSITSGELTLIGRLTLPRLTPPVPAVAFCHPHLLYGGDMENRVVAAVYRGLAALPGPGA